MAHPRLTETVAPTRYWRFLLGTGFCGRADDVLDLPGGEHRTGQGRLSGARRGEPRRRDARRVRGHRCDQHEE
jgi:hypothetical protein